jgi:hypothetical protein
MSPFECLTMAGQSKLRCDGHMRWANHRQTTALPQSLQNLSFLSLKFFYSQIFNLFFIRYRHGWCGAKTLSPRHAIVAVVKHGHLNSHFLSSLK